MMREKEESSDMKVRVLIIGGGQAGLSVSHCLKKRGIEDHVILEKNEIAHSWKNERWDSFCLVTPNYQCRLPGFQYSGNDSDGFMLKDEIVDYVQAYAKSFNPPIKEGVTVYSVEEFNDGYKVDTSKGVWFAEQVVVAIGAYHDPVIPKGAEVLSSDIAQMHSQSYLNPDQIKEGGVVVVGSGQSGCQIAEDLHLAGREVHLCLGGAPRSPRVYRGKDAVTWLEEMEYYDTPIDEHPDPDHARHSTNHYLTGRDGGREIDLRSFALDGMKLHGFVDGFEPLGFKLRKNVGENLDKADKSYLGIRKRIDEYIADNQIDAPEEDPYEPVWKPETESDYLDLEAAGVKTVIWSIGFRSNFSFVKVPVFDENGYPEFDRGVTKKAGLYFIGLPWLHTWGSGRFSGVEKDAEYLGDQIAATNNTKKCVSMLIGNCK